MENTIAACHTLPVFTVGDIVRKLRRERGLSIERLAEMAGVNKATLSALERGESNYERITLDRVARALGKTADGLLRLLPEAPVAPGGDLPNHGSTGSTEVSEGEIDPGFDVAAGYRQDDLPMIAEGEASPKPSIFWDKEGRLLSHITDRISRPSGVSDPLAYGVKVRGDSMLPVYRSGQAVVVSPAASIDDGDRVYVALKDGAHLIKVARRAEGGWLLERVIMSFPNPSVLACHGSAGYSVHGAWDRQSHQSGEELLGRRFRP